MAIRAVAALGIGSACILCLSSTCRQKAYSALAYCVKQAVSKFLYMGFKKLDPVTASERRHSLITKYGATELKPKNEDGVEIDAIYIPSNSKSKTGNVLVICLNTTYQDHNPSRWEPFLRNGADIVLWNPIKLNGIAYSNDLSSVLHSLRNQNPSQVIAIKTYCASSDPGIKAVYEQNDPNIHLIIDRGYGDVVKLARSFSLVSRLSIIETTLKEQFDCRGINKIKSVKGRILFLIPQTDQVMDCGRDNLTRDLYQLKKDAFIALDFQDHWIDWDFTTYNKVFGFLSTVGVISQDFVPVDTSDFPISPPTCLKKECVPFLIKTWC